MSRLESATVWLVAGAVRRPILTILGWGLVALLAVGAAMMSGGHSENDFSVPGSDSDTALRTATRLSPGLDGTNAIVVFELDGDITIGRYQNVVARSVDNIRRSPHVRDVSDAGAVTAISADRSTVMVEVGYDRPAHDLSAADVENLRRATTPAADVGIATEYGGQLVVETAKRGSIWAELIGILIALMVLIAVFGNVVSASMCILVSGIAVGIALSMLTVLSVFVSVPATASTLASMIGIGVAIDYSLLFVCRFRIEIDRGVDPEEVFRICARRAGVSVAIAGTTVIVALSGLLLAGLPAVSSMAYAAAVAVVLSVSASLTLLPSVLALLGPRAWLSVPSLARFAAGGDLSDLRWRRWTRWVTAHPRISLIASVALIAILASPILGIRLGQLDAGVDPTSQTQRRAYDIIATKFVEGANDPLLVTVESGSISPMGAESVRTRIADMPSMSSVSTLWSDNGSAVLSAIPEPAGSSYETADLVQAIRALSSSETSVHVGGASAAYVDFTERISDRLLLVILAIVTVSFFVLLCAFRAPVVAAKSALLNGLSILASLGVIVVIFQFIWGWPIPSFLPLLVFALVFGLSMDYEVFILSQVREFYLDSAGEYANDNRGSIVEGVGRSAQVVVPAAMIMIAVFGGFALDPDGNIRVIGVALSVAILVDATIIRLLVIPSSMMLLGRANWWPHRRALSVVDR